MKFKKEKSILPPKPVHPRNIIHHGFFGLTYLNQHMIIDERWTPQSLTEQFKKMGALLQKHAQFNVLEKIDKQNKTMRQFRELLKQCRDGRTILSRLKSGEKQEVRNILIDHRFLQRLYSKMPLDMIVENINQRTFVMRKERDRLQYRLKKLKIILEERLLERGEIECRIKYADVFGLDEDVKVRVLQKKVENSRIRIKAVKCINSTYKKIIRILRQDETFYEPILHSLDLDIEDQAKFIKHILFLGSPVIVRFKELREQYRCFDERASRSSHLSAQECANVRNLGKSFQKGPPQKTEEEILLTIRSYVRETKSMEELKQQFYRIEEIIKKVQIATLCSDERDIYPRITSQVNNNMKLVSKIEKNVLIHEVLETRDKCASVLKDVLIHNLAEDGIQRVEKINELKEAIKREDEFEEENMARVQFQTQFFILLRYFLWDLNNIMKHVGQKRITRISYPVEYLKLPLLNFEMLPTKAYPPEAFEENLLVLLNQVHTKLRSLTSTLRSDVSLKTMEELKTAYCNEMLTVMAEEDANMIPVQPEEPDPMEEVRSYAKILSRRQIKMASARIVEESMKKEI